MSSAALAASRDDTCRSIGLLMRWIYSGIDDEIGYTDHRQPTTVGRSRSVYVSSLRYRKGSVNVLDNRTRILIIEGGLNYQPLPSPCCLGQKQGISLEVLRRA
jgi:hypothetical protein